MFNFVSPFDTSGFVPRWECGAWTPLLGWLHIASDLLIWLAYLAIPVVLVYFVRSRKDIPFPRVFWLFGAFIVACGTTHLIDAFIFYHPVYRLSGVVKLVTAVVSWGTVFALVSVVPKALAMRTPQELEAEVAARTADLAAANAALRREINDRTRAEADLRARTEELKATTQQLWQAARLAGVGELAASIAHELNNPLGTVSLRIEGLLAKTPADDSRHNPLVVIEGEVERMATLVANLLQFSRTGRDQVSAVDVCEEVTKTVGLIGHHFRKHQVRVETEFATGVPTIRADRQQLRQILLNLFTNAADAMPGGGRLTVRVGSVSLPDEEPAVALEVADTGTGIPAELLPRVIDPFFTTKEEGKGTGLGLAICRRIIDQHHGSLEIESRVGEGTTVRVILPVRVSVGGLQGA
jgi:C4-dicarboxylate-specific signal transduction histidine kinase